MEQQNVDKARYPTLAPGDEPPYRLPAGRVVMELAPQFAPQHVANIKALVAERYYDGLAINRAQDNWVVQWGDPDEKNPKPILHASACCANLPKSTSASWC